MGYKITTLVENCVYGRKLQAEHGLSLYIGTAAEHSPTWNAMQNCC